MPLYGDDTIHVFHEVEITTRKVFFNYFIYPHVVVEIVVVLELPVFQSVSENQLEKYHSRNGGGQVAGRGGKART